MIKKILILIMILISSCSIHRDKINITTNRVINKDGNTYISPYYSTNYLSNAIMNSDVDDSVIPTIYQTQNEITQLLDSNYYEFFSVKDGATIEFIIRTNNMNNTDCYIEIKSNKNNICVEKKGDSYNIIEPMYRLSDYKKSSFIDVMQSEGGSHLHYIKLKLKNKNIIIAAYSLI